MSIQCQAVAYFHRITCDRCGYAETMKAEEERFDWRTWCNEHGWKRRGDYVSDDTCPECVAKEVPGVAQQAKGGVWHRYDWGNFNLAKGERMSSYVFTRMTPRRCGKRIDDDWHDVRTHNVIPADAKLCKRCWQEEA